MTYNLDRDWLFEFGYCLSGIVWFPLWLLSSSTYVLHPNSPDTGNKLVSPVSDKQCRPRSRTTPVSDKQCRPRSRTISTTFSEKEEQSINSSKEIMTSGSQLTRRQKRKKL